MFTDNVVLCVSRNYQTELFVEERKKKEEEKIKYSMKYEVRCGAGPFRSGGPRPWPTRPMP